MACRSSRSATSSYVAAIVCAVALPSAPQLAHAQSDGAPRTDPNLAHPTQLVTVARQNYSISGLVTHLKSAKDLEYGVAFFPGHPGILRLHEENFTQHGFVGIEVPTIKAMNAWIKTGAVPPDVGP